MENPTSELWSALYKSDPDLARRAIEAGARLDQPLARPNGTMALMPVQWAGVYGDARMLEVFLEKGADINGVNLPDNDLNALALLLRGANSEVDEFVCMALNAGARPDDQDDTGRQPIHHAVIGGKLDAVAMLLDHGVDANVADHRGMTGLHLVAASNKAFSTQILDLLVRCGADIEAVDEDGHRPLHHALDAGASSNLMRLLAYGASTQGIRSFHDHVNQTLSTSPMTLALEFANPDVLLLSLERNLARPDFAQLLDEAIDKATQRRRTELVDLMRSYKARHCACTALQSLEQSVGTRP